LWARRTLSPPWTRIAAAAAAGALILAASGCGRADKPPDLVRGKELFVGKGTCGSCHTLRRANTKGTQGPNLDEAFGSARRQGIKEPTIRGVVKDQIALVIRGSIMPKNLVKGQDAEDVAAYVARVAGQPGKDTGKLATAGLPAVSNKPVAAKNGKILIDAAPSGALAFTAKNANAPPGALEMIMKNPSPIQHNIAIEGGGVNVKGPVVGTGGTSTVKANVKPGKYEFLCTVPGHAAGGMRGELVVQ
jgi:mono/diheme cytochrome c family protein